MDWATFSAIFSQTHAWNAPIFGVPAIFKNLKKSLNFSA
jgi:hypothetical protein